MSGPYLDSDLNNLKDRETERKKGGKKREITDYILEGRQPHSEHKAQGVVEPPDRSQVPETPSGEKLMSSGLNSKSCLHDSSHPGQDALYSVLHLSEGNTC